MKIAHVTLALAALALAPAAGAQSPEDLLKKNGCTACHAIDKKLVGPSYMDVSQKYAKENRDAIVTRLSEKVKKGGAGVWGQVPMPPNPQANDADIKTMVSFIVDMHKKGAKK
jgi:cytochrome c